MGTRQNRTNQIYNELTDPLKPILIHLINTDHLLPVSE